MAVKIQQLLEKFPDLLRLERGSAQQNIDSLQAPTQARESDLIFVSDSVHLEQARQSAAKAWVVHTDLIAKVPDSVTHVLSSPRVQLSLAMIGKEFFAQTESIQPIKGPSISPAALIAPTARLGKDCVVGAGAVIGENCVIGDNSIIGSNAVLEPHVKIGSNTRIFPLAFIGHGCEIGNRCEILPHTTIGTEGFGYAQDQQFNHYRITHYGRVIIEDDVHIGAGVQIDRGTFLDSRVGQGTKIDNHCHFGHNVQIGRNTVITGGMITAGSTTIGSYCMFGGRATLAGHLNIADKTKFTGLSGITKDVTKSGEYGGFPLQDIAGFRRTVATIRTLPEMARQIRRILKHLNLRDDSERQPQAEQ